MDGSYGHPARHAQYPMSTQSQAGNAYQVNVKRNKTRKWVEAKTQNYDGDDWGADEFADDVESEPEPEPVPAQPPTRVQLGSGLPSSKSSRSTPSPKPGLSDLPSLRAQTWDSSARRGSVPPASDAASLASASSLRARHALHDKQDNIDGSNDYPPRTTSFDRARPSIPVPTPDDGVKLSEVDNMSERDPHIEDRRPSVSPHPLEHKISSGGQSGSGTGPRVESPLWQHSKSPTPVTQEHEAAPSREQFDHNIATGDHETDASRRDIKGTPSLADADEEESANASGGASLTAHLHEQAAPLSTRDFPSIPPLQTPRPLDSQTAVPIADPTSHNITPTEPLQPRKGEEIPVAFEPQLLHREHTLSTAGSSPIKESDMLTDEIMRTLSPRGTTPSGLSLKDDARSLSLAPSADRSSTKESGSAGQDDNPWTDGVSEPHHGQNIGFGAHGRASSASPVTDSHQAIVLTSRTPVESDREVSPQRRRGRRRFSWEAHEGDDDVQESEPATTIPAGGLSTAAPDAVTSQEQAATFPVSAFNPSGEQSPRFQTPQTQESPMGADVASQEARRQGQVSSPVSEALPLASSPMTSEQNLTTAHYQPKPSQQNTEDLATPSPPPLNITASQPPVYAASPSDQPTAAKMIPFRDILALGSTTERILKFNEARRILASQESGLSNWLLSLGAPHYDPGVNAFVTYGSSTQLPLPGGNAGSSSAPQPNSQQPYYQQYLNASASNPLSSSIGRTRLGGLTIPSQMSGSTFSHSGAQIGTKGKEFMHSAGKMGKGLLSKGKSKLRGSGDKQGDLILFSGLSKPSQDGQRMPSPLGPHANEEAVLPKLTSPLQLPIQSPALPFDVESETGMAAPWALRQSRNAAHDTKLVRTNQQTTSETFQEDPSAQPQIRDAKESRLDDWVMIPHQLGESQHEATESARHPSSAARALRPTTVPAVSDVGSLPSSHLYHDSSELPKRVSSFIGLPPIRVGSTLGLTSGGQSPEQSPIDDSIEATKGGIEGRVGGGEDTPLSIPVELEESLRENGHAVTQVEGDQASTTAVLEGNSAQTSTFKGAQDPNTNVQTHPPDLQKQVPTLPASQAHTVDLPPMTTPFQRPPPAGQWKLKESHLSEPLHPVVKKRSGTDFNQQHVLHGYSKELGLQLPVAAAPPAQPVLPRLRTDIPPSSAQRYPELFAPRPGPGARGHPHLQVQPNLNQPGMRGPPPEDREERGRRKRTSGVFKELGNRIMRAASRDRSVASERPPSANLQGEELSKTKSAAPEFQERRKKRSSFLGLGSRRSSIDQSSQRPDMSIFQQSRSRGDVSVTSTPPGSRGEQNHPMMAANQDNTFSTRSFSAINLLGNGRGASGESKEQKRRVSGIAGLFSRSRQDYNASNASNASTLAQAEYQNQDSSRHLPPSVDAKPRARANTVGSPVAALQNEARNDVAYKHQSQQMSAPGLLLGRGLSLRARESPRGPYTQTRHREQEYQLPHPELGSPILSSGHLQETLERAFPASKAVQQPSTSLVAASAVNGRASQLLSSPPLNSSPGPNISAVEGIPRLQIDMHVSPPRLASPGKERKSEDDQAEVSPDHLAHASPSLRIGELAFEEGSRGLQNDQSRDDPQQKSTNIEEGSQSTGRSSSRAPSRGPQSVDAVSLEPGSGSVHSKKQDAGLLREASPRIAQSSISRDSSMRIIEHPSPLTSSKPQVSTPAIIHTELVEDVEASRDATRPAPISKTVMAQTTQRTKPMRPDILELVGSAASPVEEQDAQASRWMGIRSRMTGLAQMSQQQAQDRAVKGDKLKGSKLLGALRRSAKQVEPLNAQYVQRGANAQHRASSGPSSPRPGSDGMDRPSAHRSAGGYQQGLAPQGHPPATQSNRGEPQYDPVPIPRGYYAVHGEGISVPSPYQIRRQAPFHQDTSPQHHGVQQWHGQQQRADAGFQPRSPGRQETLRSHLASQSASDRPSRMSGVSDASVGRSSRSVELGKRGESQGRGEDERGEGGKAAVSQWLREASPASPGASIGRRGGSTTPYTDMQSYPQSPAWSTRESISQGHFLSSLGVDLSTPKQQEDNMQGGKVSEQMEGAGVQMEPVELEDTEEARKRAIRLASQEEKIVVDPEDYEPKMSATSYPGQEWNPCVGDLEE